MHLLDLELESFRNYAHLRVPLPRGLIVLEGRNAQGKTALLESLHLLATARSFRAPAEADMIRWDQPFARVRAHLCPDSGVERELEVRYLRSPARKELRLMGQPVKKLGEFLGALPLALFTPDDLQLVCGPPGERRRFLDLLLCKLYPAYLVGLTRYQKTLRQRSELLKQGSVRPADLEPWDDLLATLGSDLIARRERLCQPLAEALDTLYRQLSGEDLSLRARYRPSGSSEAQGFRLALEARRSEELRLRSCLVGPHRDELVMTLGSMDMRRFGSQGQRRSLALAMRLAQARLLTDLGGERALVLLDDCFSELDPFRQARLLELLAEVPQVFITSATPVQLGLPAALFRVEAGQLQPENSQTC